MPFLNPLSSENAPYQHIEYTGCGAIAVTEVKLEKLLGNTYPGLFSKGLPAEAITNCGIPLDSPYICACLHDPTKYQVSAMDDDAIAAEANRLKTDEQTVGKVKQIAMHSRMDDAQLRAYVEGLHPQMRGLFDCWNNSPMKNLTLTSVGIAIGHSNVRRVTGEGAPLSVWIKT